MNTHANLSGDTAQQLELIHFSENRPKIYSKAK